MPNKTIRFCIIIAALLASTGIVEAANLAPYDDRTAFAADTSAIALTDFETVTASCVSIPGANGLTVNNINLNGGVARYTSSGPCSPPLTAFQGYVISTRLVIRSDAPGQAVTTATLPPGVMSVGFDTGVNSDPVGTRIQVTLVTSDNKEQTFTLTSQGTGSGASRRVTPLFAGFTSSRPITSVQFRVPDIIDSNLILDNFLTGQAAPPVVNASGVVNGASYQASFAPNTWITIFGQCLSGPSRLWGEQDFSGTRLPTSIEDISVTVDGKPAYVYYVSPGQVNVLTPAVLSPGPAVVEVSRGDLKSVPVAVQAQGVAPGLFLFDPENRRYAAATHADGSLVGKASLYPGASTPARPSEVIVLWATGFGATTPDIPDGEIVIVPTRLPTTPLVSIGGVTADVQYAGLSGAGLYQVNVKVPDGLPDGDQAVVVQVEGLLSQDGVFLTVQR